MKKSLQKMQAELYSSGNVACIPLVCLDYERQIQEFHAESVCWKGREGE